MNSDSSSNAAVSCSSEEQEVKEDSDWPPQKENSIWALAREECNTYHGKMGRRVVGGGGSEGGGWERRRWRRKRRGKGDGEVCGVGGRE